jgi:DNA transposition AAA+ family ATPase
MKVDEFIGKRKVNITQLAKQIGYDQAYLNKILNGYYKPSKKVADALTEASNGQITYDDLFEVYKERHKNK